MLFSRFNHREAEAFGALVRAARAGAGWTQQQLAVRCVPQLKLKRLSLLERGRVKIRPHERAALRRELPLLDELLAPRKSIVRASAPADPSAVAR